MAIGREIRRRKRSSPKKKKGFLSATSLSVSNSNKLNKILEARRSKVSFINPIIKNINKRTVRVIKGKVAKGHRLLSCQIDVRLSHLH